MRSDDDEWDLSGSVGKTAMIVALGRALETLADDPLFIDEFAAAFLRAAGEPVPERIPAAGTGPLAAPVTVTCLVSTRTRFFDDYCDAAVAAGIEQFVVLAAGLDARALRLHWPAETVVYEIDQPQVIAFKDRVLAELKATPACDRRTIGCDLRGEWVDALRSAGFNPAIPTAWLAEALTPYLPDTAQEQLFANITSLSAPGSWLSFDVVGASVMHSASRDQAFRAVESEYEFKLDVLVYADRPFDDEAWLTAHGWAIESETLATAAARYNRPVPDEILGTASDYRLKIAHLASGRS